MPSEAQWKSIKRLVDAGWRATDIEKRFPRLITARQIYSKKRTWSKEEWNKNSKYHTPVYKAWRMAVFKKYKFRCAVCKIKGSRYNPLQADHIIPWSVNVEKRYLVSNGRCLCLKHHKQTPTWGRKALNYGKSTKK